MFAEDELLPISALQHFVFCRRQAALIHVERLWRDDERTVEGTHMHAVADSGLRESRGKRVTLRGVPLVNRRLGITGRADVVELTRADGDPSAASLPALDGTWRIEPVEYKRGRPKGHRADEVQLCAQALCLEEMFSTSLAQGSLFYGETRRRKVVALDKRLQELTESVITAMREVFSAGRTPPPEPGPKCRRCSLLDDCQPWGSMRSASSYVATLFAAARENP
jgi:CRISPR-associated exonuclease Cas4